MDNYIKNDDDYEWSGPPLILFKKEWKNQNVKEWDIVFSSYISTEGYTKWEFPITTRFLLFPFSLFSYLKSKKDNRLLIFSPLYFRKRFYENDYQFFWIGFYDKQKENSIFCPIYIFCLKEDPNKTANWLFPIYYYSKSKKENQTFFISIFHILITPIYTGPMPGSKSYLQEDEYWRNWFVLFHFRYKRLPDRSEPQHYLKRFVFFPIFWWNRNYNQQQNNIETDYLYFIPFYFTNKNEKGQKNFENFFVILTKNYDFTNDEKQITYTKSYFFLPLLIYWRFEPLKNNQSIVYNNDKVETYTRTFISPLYIKYNNKEEKHNWQWFLLYFDWENLGESQDSNSSFLQKNLVLSTNTDSSINQDNPKNYSYSNASKGSLFFPLWYYKNYEPLNEKENHKIFISPLYFQFDNTKENKKYLWSLIYYEWHTSKSNGVVWFPIRFKYQDKRKDFDLWLAYNVSSNKAKIKNNHLYIDMDHSFLYNVVRFSTRKKIALTSYSSSIFHK
jgi:hypothetical protein